MVPRPDAGERLVFAPSGVRVLAVVVWVGLAAYLVLLVRQGSGADALRFLPVAALVALVVHATFWRPSVRVDDDRVVLRNVLRDVAVPFARLDGVDTKYALRLQSGDHGYTAWAAPAPGRTSAMSLTRRDAAATALLGTDVSRGVTASAAPNTDSGGAALMVQLRWQRWLERDRLGAGTSSGGDTERVTTTWNVPVAAACAVLAAASAAVVLR